MAKAKAEEQDMQPLVYTVAQVAQMLQVTRASVLNWIREGRIAAIRVSPRSTRIRRDELERILAHGVFTEAEADPTGDDE